MAAGKQETIDQLKAIFPQRSQIIINTAYEEAEGQYGPNSQPFILTSCIEKLLEVPDSQPNEEPQNAAPPPNNFQATHSLLDSTRSDSESDDSLPLLHNDSNDSNHAFGYQDSDAASDNSSEDDDIYNPNTNGAYRNRNSFISHRGNADSDDSNASLNLLENDSNDDIPLNLLGDLPFDDSDDFLKEVQVIEERSTRPDLVKHKVYEKDDILVIGNNDNAKTPIGPAFRSKSTPKHQTLLNNLGQIGSTSATKTSLFSKRPSTPNYNFVTENDFTTLNNNTIPNSITTPVSSSFKSSSTYTPRTSSSSTSVTSDTPSTSTSTPSTSSSTPKVVVKDINRKRKHSTVSHTPVAIEPEPEPAEEKFPVHLLQYGMEGFMENAISQIVSF